MLLLRPKIPQQLHWRLQGLGLVSAPVQEQRLTPWMILPLAYATSCLVPLSMDSTTLVRECSRTWAKSVPSFSTFLRQIQPHRGIAGVSGDVVERCALRLYAHAQPCHKQFSGGSTSTHRSTAKRIKAISWEPRKTTCMSECSTPSWPMLSPATAASRLRAPFNHFGLAKRIAVSLL